MSTQSPIMCLKWSYRVSNKAYHGCRVVLACVSSPCVWLSMVKQNYVCSSMCDYDVAGNIKVAHPSKSDLSILSEKWTY